MRRRGPIKRLTRRIRLAIYHRRFGPGFNYHGIPIAIPEEIPFGIKKQLMQGRYEEPERRLIERFVDPKQSLVELGGSLGVLSAYIGRKLAPETPFLVVEANPRIIEACTANARAGRGPDGRLTVMNCALAYGASEVSFPVGDNVHVNRLSGARRDLQETATVPAHTLAEFRRALDLRPGSFTLVMDIEGSEFDVLVNDREVLESCSLAIVETHPHLFVERGKTLEDFLDLVHGAGFHTLARDGNTFAFHRT